MDSFFRKKMSSLNGEDNRLKNYQNCESTGMSSSSSRIEELWETKRQALLAQMQIQTAAQNSRNSAVLQRHKLPPLQPTSDRRGAPGSSHLKHGQKLTPLKEKVVRDDKRSRTPRGPKRSPDLNDFEEDEGRLSTDWSYNHLDNHTPDELRNLPHIRTPVSPPLSNPVTPPWSPPLSSAGPPQAFPKPNSRVRRLPVLKTNLLGEDKRVSGGYRLQTATGQIQTIQSGLLNLSPKFSLLTPRPPAPRRAKGAPKQFTPALISKPSLPQKTESLVTPPQSAPPPKPSPPPKQSPPPKPSPPPKQSPPPKPAPSPKPSPPKERESSVTSPQPAPPPTSAPEMISWTKQRRSVRPAQPIGGAKKPASCKPPSAENVELKELKPLSSPEESLTLFFELLSSGDWEKKIKGLEIVQALAQHHANTLKSKLTDVCYAVIEEVKNLRSCVASVAIDTVVYLHVYLQRGMDSMADTTGSALLLKIAQSTANTFLRQQATKALDSLVQNCSPGQVLNVLLRTGLRHLCVAVRVSTAEKLHLLAARLGAPAILKTGKGFSKNFVTAVNQMCVDASAEVRPHGITILEELAFLPNFTELWESVVPQKERPVLLKILKKMRE